MKRPPGLLIRWVVQRQESIYCPMLDELEGQAKGFSKEQRFTETVEILSSLIFTRIASTGSMRCLDQVSFGKQADVWLEWQSQQ